MHIRLIPRLDIKGERLVKGVHLEGLRVLGKPEEFARHYYECGADELAYIDVVASLYERNSILDLIRRTSSEIFIPLAVGGGLRSVEDIRLALKSGADKVIINTAAIKRPDLINEASRKFGSSTIVIMIEAKRSADGRYESYTDCGRERTGLDACAWAVEAVSRGAGELMVTSVDREGTGRGYDLELTRLISQRVPVPVIASGGAGKIEDIKEVIEHGYADAVSMASIVHYDFLSSHGNDMIRGARSAQPLSNTKKNSAIQHAPLSMIKQRLSNDGIKVRDYTPSLVPKP